MPDISTRAVGSGTAGTAMAVPVFDQLGDTDVCSSESGLKKLL